MPLIKKLCQKCWGSITDIEWIDIDEISWDNGIVECPEQYIGEEDEKALRKITDHPPSKCPYLLEQILNQGNK